MASANPDCPECFGTGNVEGEYNPPHPPKFERCECVQQADILQNVEKALKGLSMQPVVKQSPLAGAHQENLWITAGSEFLPHLRHVAIRRPPHWFLQVSTDADLITAWLATISLQGGEIHDADAIKTSTRFLTVVDLAEPPDLLVLRMGVKVARNAAAPEVLAEVLNHRLHIGKPTWVWDQPTHPLDTGHLCWSSAVGQSLSSYRRVKDLSNPAAKKRARTPGRKTGRRAPSRTTLRRGGPE